MAESEIFVYLLRVDRRIVGASGVLAIMSGTIEIVDDGIYTISGVMTAEECRN